MRKVGGLSQKEIADITGCSENTVESYLNEGKTLLDRELAEQLDPQERSLVMAWLWPRRRSRDYGK
jgi:DNA-directed RNA polymerase specialized sigma24 family protein